MPASSSRPFRLGVLVWNQYTDWPSFRDIGARADRLGYDQLWTWDHLYPIVGSPGRADARGVRAARRLGRASPSARRSG